MKQTHLPYVNFFLGVSVSGVTSAEGSAEGRVRNACEVCLHKLPSPRLFLSEVALTEQ